MAESSSSAETSTSSNFSGSSHSTNFTAYTSEVESDSEVNSSEAGRVDVCKIIIMWNYGFVEWIIGLNYQDTFRKSVE